jgi:TolB-like protein
MMRTVVTLILSIVLMCGCASTVQHGCTTPGLVLSKTLFLAPFENATDDDHAGQVLTEVTSTALLQEGEEVIRSTPSTEDVSSGPADYQQIARQKGAAFVIYGTVQEYRYKADLDGDPAVGISLRAVEASTGKTVWQASGSKTGMGCSSLTEASQLVVRDVVKQMPLPRQRGR